MLTTPFSDMRGWTWVTRSPTLGTVLLAGTGPSRALRAMVSGSVRIDVSGSRQVITGMPTDLLLPDIRSMLDRLRFGNLEVVLRYVGAPFAGHEWVRGAPLLAAGGASIEASSVEIQLRFPSHPAIDSLGVLREIAALELDAGLGSWAAAVTGEPALRFVGPHGRPFDTSIELSIDDEVFTLAPSHAGDLLAAWGRTRAALDGGRTLRFVGRIDGVDTPGTMEMATPEGAAGIDGVTLDPETSYVSATLTDAWFADQGAEQLSRFTRGNRVTPLVGGPEYFADLFARFDNMSSTTPVLYLSGCEIHHAARLGPSTARRRTLLDAAIAIETAGGESRFLAMDFLQIDEGTVFDYEAAAFVVTVAIFIVGFAVAVAGNIDEFDRYNAVGTATAMLALAVSGTIVLGDLVPGLEPSAAAVSGLGFASGASLAFFDPYPATLADNPRGDSSHLPLSLLADVTSHFGIFHQKLAVVRDDDGIVAYCGGTDARAHDRRAHVHELHARVVGPAVQELATTFIERWNREHGETPLELAAPGSFDGLPSDGPEVVQVARTYFRAAEVGRALDFASNGERTILDTMLRAIEQARHYIYIEDRCLTPPEAYTRALEAAAARGVALIIAVPDHPQQPFGLAPRQAFVERMRTAWASETMRERLRIGTLRRPYSRLNATRTASLGRLRLTEAVREGMTSITLAPAARVPQPPYWLAVGDEVMWVTGNASAAGSVGRGEPGTRTTVDVVRGGDTNLLGVGRGTPVRAHASGAPATVIQHAGVDLRSAVTLIDDCFAAIGSASLSHRGLLSDGECTLFCLREQLNHGENWIRTLRKRLWGELLGVPEPFALAMLDDPLAHLHLFDRPVSAGNRFAEFAAHPFGLEFGGLGGSFRSDPDWLDFTVQLLSLLGGLFTATIDPDQTFETIIDPSNRQEDRP